MWGYSMVRVWVAGPLVGSRANALVGTLGTPEAETLRIHCLQILTSKKHNLKMFALTKIIIISKMLNNFLVVAVRHGI